MDVHFYHEPNPNIQTTNTHASARTHTHTYLIILQRRVVGLSFESGDKTETGQRQDIDRTETGQRQDRDRTALVILTRTKSNS